MKPEPSEGRISNDRQAHVLSSTENCSCCLAQSSAQTIDLIHLPLGVEGEVAGKLKVEPKSPNHKYHQLTPST